MFPFWDHLVVLALGARDPNFEGHCKIFSLDKWYIPQIFSNQLLVYPRNFLYHQTPMGPYVQYAVFRKIASYLL